MRLFKTNKRKPLLIIVISIVTVIGIAIALISPLAKYLIEKHDLRYLGREVTIDWAYINPFTGFVYLHNLDIKESKNDTTFFSAESVSGNFAMLKMFYRTYELTELKIQSPVGFVIQKKRDLNFNDLIEKFRGGKSNKPRVHFSILRIIITNGEFHYREKIIPIDYVITNVNIESTGKPWDVDTIASKFSFQAGHGTLTGNFTINTHTQDYRLATAVHGLDLELIRQYLWELINYGMFSARLDADIQASGNFLDVNRVSIKGKLSINDFRLGKTTTEDYISCKRLSIVIDELSPRNNKYLFDSVTLDDGFVSYERFDSLDNVQAMFGKEGSNISDVTKQQGRFNLVIQISRYIKRLSEKFFESQYRINSLAVNNGNFKFTDYSLSERFSIQAHSISLKADSITKTNKRVKFKLQAGIFPYGNLQAGISINPLDSGDLDLNYQLQNVPVTAFNPYFITHTSFPLNKGTLELNGQWKVRHGIISSQNQIMIVDPRIGSRVKGDDTKWIPMPLIMTFVRERGNIINYKIPISGNLKDPKFHLRDVITDLLQNIFIKPPTVSYGLEVKKAEKEIEKLLAVTWAVHQFSLEPEQRKFLKKMAAFLEKNPEASIDIYSQPYNFKEWEHILFFEARKKYYLRNHGKSENDFTKEDSINTENMSVKDLRHCFVNDLTTITRDTTMFTIHDKCRHFVGDRIVNLKYQQLLQARDNNLRSFFTRNNTSNRVTIHTTENVIPFDGFSSHQIRYNGNIPESLRKSYSKMHMLNSKNFRKKYFSN